MSKYCCFNCPEIGHDDSRELDDKCPNCGNEYRFPLKYPPKRIKEFEIKEPINRGFYGSIYKVIDESLNLERVIKVIPKSIYALHKKDFSKECREHAELARVSQHIVNIITATDGSVIFSNGIEIDCHIAVLDYIPGPVLKKIITNGEIINSFCIAQIAIDLFRILAVLRNKQKNHNDLHDENLIIQNLNFDERRQGEIYENIRVVAIDIGSLNTENKSKDTPDRQGDVHWVASYLLKLSEKLLKIPDKTSDQNYRLASLLEDRAKLLFPAAEHQRIPNYDELIENIKNCIIQQSHPWEEPLKLLNFNDSYNAQTLMPWYVPSLLVDPDDQWLRKISGRGPLVITGMRGCGKTMMLRVLQFHARASLATKSFRDNQIKQIEYLKEEAFIGIYISSNKLLDQIGKSADDPLHLPFSKLFIRYGIEAIYALRHLKTISSESVKSDYYLNFVDVYKQHLSNSEILDNIQSEMQLEQKLQLIISSLNRGESDYAVESNPANAFPALAQTIRESTQILKNSYVLFLLDDVSTRFLGEKNINYLLSSLIFQSEICAFKITSEVQTIELVLYSPGKIEKAKKGRDFDTFDLGGAVNQKIRDKGGKQFVFDILNRRARSNPKHPQQQPVELIGDVTLKEIAENIVKRGKDKSIKKKIYHGISALAGVCVGDIGEIINLYDMIIKKDDKQIPIDAEKQSECFQDLCSIRLQELNKWGSNYKDFALSFADASHALLMKSARDGDSRLRQYYSIYVRITTGNTEILYDKIMELLDAGIFVYSGGASTPRTLGKDTNPINQFKLTYRKLYGISKYIGLTQGDRFELSGKNLEMWLNNPSKGKEILMKNVGGASSNVDEGTFLDEELIDAEISTEKESVFIQQDLFLSDVQINDQTNYEKDVKKLVKKKTPISEQLKYENLKEVNFDLLIAGLGFEDRALEAVIDLTKLNIKKILLIRYEEKGKSKEIIDVVKKLKIDYEVIDYEQVKTSFDINEKNILCDITGMSKSLIFNIVRNVLITSNKIWLSHIQAKIYYPLNDEIELALNKVSNGDNYSKLDLITKNVLKGEKGPYEIYDLLFSDTDESKRNLLVGFSTAKYERLFKILDNRQFSNINIISPNTKSKRSQLANLATEVIKKSKPNVESFRFSTNALSDILKFLTSQYQKYYIDQNYNFEIALTGSKRNTVACAALCAAFKISHSWYIKPSIWDTMRFSKGTGKKAYFHLSIDSNRFD